MILKTKICTVHLSCRLAS